MAIEMFEEGFYNVVVVDYNMPITNGYETAVKIKEVDLADTPIFVISSAIDHIPVDQIKFFTGKCSRENIVPFIKRISEYYDH